MRVSVCVCVYACLLLCVHTCMCASAYASGGQLPAFRIIPRVPFTLLYETVSLVDLELIKWTRLMGQKSTELCLFLSPQNWDDKIFFTPTSTSRMKQALHWLSYHSSPQAFIYVCVWGGSYVNFVTPNQPWVFVDGKVKLISTVNVVFTVPSSR